MKQEIKIDSLYLPTPYEYNALLLCIDFVKKKKTFEVLIRQIHSVVHNEFKVYLYRGDSIVIIGDKFNAHIFIDPESLNLVAIITQEKIEAVKNIEQSLDFTNLKQ